MHVDVLQRNGNVDRQCTVLLFALFVKHMFELTNRIFQHNVPRAISCHNFRMKLFGCCELSSHLGAPSTFDVVILWNISVLVLIVSSSVVVVSCGEHLPKKKDRLLI